MHSSGSINIKLTPRSRVLLLLLLLRRRRRRRRWRRRRDEEEKEEKKKNPHVGLPIFPHQNHVCMYSTLCVPHTPPISFSLIRSPD